MWKVIEQHIWKRVRVGFFAFIPVLATYIVLRFLLGYLDGLLMPTLGVLPVAFPGMGFLILLVLFYLLGFVFMMSARAGKMTIEAQNAILSRIPVVKSIYRVTKQAADNLATYGGHSFKRVVLVEWPRRDVLALGFVTGQCTLQGDDEDRLAIYIPTVPNPTSGMFALMASSEVVETDIPVEDALKLVLSGGIVLPAEMSEITLPRRPSWSPSYSIDVEDGGGVAVRTTQPPIKFPHKKDVQLKVPITN